MTILDQANSIIAAKFAQVEHDKYVKDIRTYGVGFLTRIDGIDVHVPIPVAQAMVRQWMYRQRNP